MTNIYLDHAATSPTHPDVLQAMLPYFTETFGNPSSLHGFGRAARASLNDARDRLARSLGCRSGELIFTGGGTESDNLALFGIADAYGGSRRHIITTSIEHHAVLHSCRQLAKMGFDITYTPVDSTGRVSAEDVKAALRPDTLMISMMYGNNEVGTVQPVEAVGRAAKEAGVFFHVDAVQALGLLPINLSALPVDLMSFASHKINGPKGVGALYLNSKVKITPTLHGGTQERKRRAGTENIAGIAGFAKAVEIAEQTRESKRAFMLELRATLLQLLKQKLGEDGVVLNGHPHETLGHILNVSFPGCNTETLLMNLDLEGIAAASGSACSSGSLELSHVLEAMHLPEEVTHSAVRFSFGLGNTIEQIETAAGTIATIVNRIRNKG